MQAEIHPSQPSCSHKTAADAGGSRQCPQLPEVQSPAVLVQPWPGPAVLGASTVRSAESHYSIALICALVRSVHCNYILALKRVKREKKCYFDVLVFVSQQHVLEGNYSDLSSPIPALYI